MKEDAIIRPLMFAFVSGILLWNIMGISDKESLKEIIYLWKQPWSVAALEGLKFLTNFIFLLGLNNNNF